MDRAQRNLLVNRLISGLFIVSYKNVKYLIKEPDIVSKSKADALYEKVIEDNKYNRWFRKSNVEALLVGHKLLLPNHKFNLAELEKRCDDLKVSLFRSIFRIKEMPKIKKNLQLVKNKIEEQYTIMHSLDYVTVEGLAAMVKNEYLFFHSIYDINENKLFRDEQFNTINYHFLNNLMLSTGQKRLTIEQLKELARTDPWRSYWNAGKGQSIFAVPIGCLNEEQRNVILFSRMYDNIYEHPDCPSDAVIEDDDLLDGWMILQKRERDRGRAERQAETGMHSGRRQKQRDGIQTADDVFIPVSSKEEIKKVQELNTLEGRVIQQQRRAAIKQKGQLKDSSLPDVQQDLQMEAQKLYKDKVKGKQNG